MSKDEKQYEIVMYKLLAIVLIGIFVSLGIGYSIGNTIGRMRAIDTMVIERPEYCWAERQGNTITLKCNEANVPITSLCESLSDDIKQNFRIVIVS